MALKRVLSRHPSRGLLIGLDPWQIKTFVSFSVFTSYFRNYSFKGIGKPLFTRASCAPYQLTRRISAQLKRKLC